MRLCDHPEFKQAILAASEHFKEQGLRPSIIEKDYYVTEVLRIIASWGGDKIIFKGGTSLSKGWGIIERFSEDVDIFLNPEAFDPPLGANPINRELKNIRDAVGSLEMLTYLNEESQTFGGIGRHDRFSYEQHFGGVGEISNRVLVELGTASGAQPVQIMKLDSYLSRFLKKKGYNLATEDEEGFEMLILHFRRTFVEKMFAIHGKVEKSKKDGNPIGKYARHYYDLYRISLRPEVIAMLRSPEYEEIKEDYEGVSLRHFPRDYVRPSGMNFSNSEALFPPKDLSVLLQKEYERECSTLCYGTYPSWDALMRRFLEIRSIL